MGSRPPYVLWRTGSLSTNVEPPDRVLAVPDLAFNELAFLDRRSSARTTSPAEGQRIRLSCSKSPAEESGSRSCPTTVFEDFDPEGPGAPHLSGGPLDTQKCHCGDSRAFTATSVGPASLSHGTSYLESLDTQCDGMYGSVYYSEAVCGVDEHPQASIYSSPTSNTMLRERTVAPPILPMSRAVSFGWLSPDSSDAEHQTSQIHQASIIGPRHMLPCNEGHAVHETSLVFSEAVGGPETKEPTLIRWPASRP